MTVGRNVACAGGVVVAALSTAGCAAENVDVTRLYSPAEVAETHGGAQQGLKPVAVVRGSQTIPIPADATLDGNRFVLHGPYVRKLAEGDVIEQDEAGHILGVRTQAGDEIHFVPGTAVSPPDADYVRGQLEGSASAIALLPTDKVLMKGSFAQDVAVPGGGRVESTRSTGLLIAGGVLFGIAYLPSAYIGASSHLGNDRVLLIPLVGPWIDLATRPSCVPPAAYTADPTAFPVNPCIPETASRWALVASGSVQGLAVVLGAFGLPSRVQIVNADHGVAKAAQLSVSVVPTATLQGAGAALQGSF